ncbi:tail fiber protein / tail tubular protein A [Enterobacter phage 02_vB_Eclo_IJM]|nr:tail fiber protein / tail tubular protein A [Enterobacter phage 02_vB_Eclo_IJM]
MPLLRNQSRTLRVALAEQPDILRSQTKARNRSTAGHPRVMEKRPPTVWKKRLGIDVGSAPKFHLINRDEVEQYYRLQRGVHSGGRPIRNQYSVSGNMDYVRTSNPRMTSGYHGSRLYVHR